MAVKGTQTRTKRRSATARFRISRFVVFFIWGFAITWETLLVTQVFRKRLFQYELNLAKTEAECDSKQCKHTAHSCVVGCKERGGPYLRCPQKVPIKSVQMKCPQKVSTTSVKKCPQKVS